MSKFDIQDQEVIAMCNARRIREEMAREQSRIVDADYVVVDEMAEARLQVLKRVAGVAARAMIGCAFLGAISRGWVIAPFGLAATGACFLWAWIHARSHS